jgi:CRP-like cAMP-binding protein
MTHRLPPTPSNPATPRAPRPALTNRILRALPPEESSAIKRHLSPVEFQFDQVVYGYGDRIATVYFPDTFVSSATLTMEDGRTVEVGTFGNESAVGLSAWMGMATSPTTVISQIAGKGQAMPLDALTREAAALPQFNALLHRAVQVNATQAMHSAACNGLHSIEERLARWLLMTHDRVQADNMPLTQQFLAYMLGVYRPSVTIVARTLQNAGLIRYERGSVTIVDREGLESAACECYRTNKAVTDSLIPPVAEPSLAR